MGTALTTMHSNGALALTDPEMEERRQLLANVIMRNGTPAQVDLVMHLCGRYGLDPLLKHIVLINGAPYVTRDGLLHIAHASGKFDGIEVELAQAKDGEWAATCTVWRKGSERPIRYTAYEKEHKPKNPGASAWGTYPRAMLTKCAEVMALRRAFDVSLGAVEELGYDGQQPQSSIGQVVTIERPQLAATIAHDPDDDLPEYAPAPPTRTTPPAAQPVAPSVPAPALAPDDPLAEVVAKLREMEAKDYTWDTIKQYADEQWDIADAYGQEIINATAKAIKVRRKAAAALAPPAPRPASYAG